MDSLCKKYDIYKCLSRAHVQVGKYPGGTIVQGGPWSRGTHVRGTLVRGTNVQENICPGDTLHSTVLFV